MPIHNHGTSRFWASCAAALGLMVALQTTGAFQSPSPREVKIAMVDMNKAFKNLQMTADANAQKEDLVQRAAAEGKAIAKKGEALEVELEALVKDTDKYNETLAKIRQALIDYKVHTDFIRMKVEERDSEKYRSVFEAIKDEAKKFAIQYGYDIVLVNDSLEEIQRGPTESVVSQIAIRRVLYATDEIDITDALIEWINTRQQQAQAKP